MKDFIKHLFGHIWEYEYDIDGKIRHRCCRVCYTIEYAADFVDELNQSNKEMKTVDKKK